MFFYKSVNPASATYLTDLCESQRENTFHASVKRLPDGSAGKESACSAGDTGDAGLIPGSGRPPGGGNGNPVQYSCLKNSMNRGAWWTTIQRIAKSWTQLINYARKKLLAIFVKKEMIALPRQLDWSALFLFSPSWSNVVCRELGLDIIAEAADYVPMYGRVRRSWKTFARPGILLQPIQIPSWNMQGPRDGSTARSLPGLYPEASTFLATHPGRPSPPTGGLADHFQDVK